ncbi:clavaminate synthase-like protein At3g21360 [Lactuca sativa]|uniref:clavaminate synthase-like protein At3g21360 n=1 Tax=Lactuca sativa TaxID=4236 RepID=UPI000CB45B3F|nr:clavaminate synthase-like protein At3g21360 [Lactuca sativa]
MAGGRFFREVELPEQKSHVDGVLFPAVLSPIFSTAFSADAQLCGFVDAIRAHKPWLESLLQKRGVILFRDFPVTSPSDFNDVVEAFGFPEAFYVGGRASRTQVVGRVYTANESPPEMQIPFHHEMAYVPDFPSKLLFFCEEAPEAGGETPVLLSHIIYDKMKEKHPLFVAKLEEHGLTYTRVMTDDNQQSSFNGSGWTSAYMTNDKNVAEERAAKLGTKLEWMGSDHDHVKAITGPMPGIRFDKESQRKVWFNGLAVSYSGSLTTKNNDRNTFIELGNGEPVSDEAMEDCLRIMEEECVAIPWKKGDVMLVNNLMVLHSRRPLIKPPRSILASLCK